MLNAKAEPMPIATFPAWAEGQAERYELVGGVPVRMMAGARNVHDDIVVNLLTLLKTRLRGGGCPPFTGDGTVETLPGQIRRPDVGVGCGPRDPNALKAADPRLVAEVLSPTTRDFEAFAEDSCAKLGEYQGMAGLAHILLIEPNAPEIHAWARDADGGWRGTVVAGLDATLDVPSLGIALRLTDIYDSVVFPARPRLVADASDPAA